MAKRMLFFSLTLTVIFVSALNVTWATPTTVMVDVSSLNGADVQLEFALFDNNKIVGDSYVLIDNVALDPENIGFEDGEQDLGGFDVSLNPDNVSNVSGALPGDPGSRQLRMNDDPEHFPIITLSFSGYSGTQLRFDFEFVSASGSPDSFVASLYNPVNLKPFLAEGVMGTGDAAFLQATGTGNTIAPGVVAGSIQPVPEPFTFILDTDEPDTIRVPIQPIPEPSTVILMLAGLGGIVGYCGIKFSRKNR